MPLRDHFRPPVSKHSSWEALFGGWPAVVVQTLRNTLPEGFVAGPWIRPGIFSEVGPDNPDIRKSKFYPDDVFPSLEEYPEWLRSPAVRSASLWGEFSEYEVHVRNRHDANQVVAVIAFVTLGNKSSAAARRVFLTKCLAALLNGVAVTIVDVITPQPFNLYHDLLASLDHPDPSMTPDPPDLYAATIRLLQRKPRSLLESWSERLAVGQPLPKLPLWLGEDLIVPLDLERSYEQTCHDLRIE